MKLYHITNKNFQVTVKKKGAELSSFKSLNSDKEYIWQGDPEIWSGQAPNLFPIIGCLKKGSFIYEAKEFNCPKHGFIRNNDNIILKEQTDNSLTFYLKYDKETLKVYPFKFEFQIKYLLKENELTLQHTIINHGLNAMFFSLGGHPGFNCPLNKGETYTDYYLEFSKEETAETWRVLDNGLIDNKTKPVFNTPSTINLHPQIFNKDALVFKNLNSNKVKLKSKKSKQVVSVTFTDFPYLGIWAKTDAPYVCIEPWLGIADHLDADRNLKNKEGIINLKAKHEFKASYKIKIEEI